MLAEVLRWRSMRGEATLRERCRTMGYQQAKGGSGALDSSPEAT